MDLRITPDKLSGQVTVPPSKSVAHRMIIAAALSDGRQSITALSPSADILATMDCMRALGAEIAYKNGVAEVLGVFAKGNIPESASADCCESGSTLRFLIPVACALGIKTEFLGRGKLPERPIKPFLDEFPGHGIAFDLSRTSDGQTLPCSVSGKLRPGRFEIDGGISSQFITGLLFALPLLEGDSEIILTSPLQSKPYIDITVSVLDKFGIAVEKLPDGWHISGNQHYKPFSGAVEGDYSQAAFFYVANALGSRLEILGLDKASVQGDRRIVEICEEYGGSRRAFELDCSDIPDLVPILTVFACFCRGKSRLTNVARLRIKECDRLAAMEECLNRIGGKVSAGADFIGIEGVEALTGGEVSCFNDHRIAMSMAIAATFCKNDLIIRGAECVSKSYPDFFEVYRRLGGKAAEI